MGTLDKRENESRLEYIWRLGNEKDFGRTELDWEELTDIINRNLCDDESEYKCSSAYRKPYQSAKMYYDEVFSRMLDGENHDGLSEDQRDYVEKTKLRDERNEIARMLRSKARGESFIDLVRDAVSRDVKRFDRKYTETNGGENDLVVHVTDMHTGIEISNGKNRFDQDVLYERMQRYLDRLYEIIRIHHIRDCHVLIGGDMISGIIHPNLRLENNMNVIEQVKYAVNILSEFIDALSEKCSNVYVHSVSGNHSRMSPNKEQHLKGEELDALIPYCLGIAFSSCGNVFIDERSEYGDYISVFRVLGHMFAGIHGDKDQPQNAPSNIARLTGEFPEVVLTGHRHKNAMYTDDFGTRIIQSGSISGPDNYAYDKRLVAGPEQVSIVVSEKNAIEALYDIRLS